METFLTILGFILLWIAIGVGRKDDSKIIFLSGEWWLIFLFVFLGTLLIANNMHYHSN
jgi:uncharacterized membrane protein YhaH (DUF805 family)